MKLLLLDLELVHLELDFKMEWGIERKEEEYPTRIKHEVEIFDLKKFVMDERNKKMAQDSGIIKDNNPFKPMDMGMSSYNPFGPMPNMNKPSGIGNMDIDSIMKDLDEKFKELDRQEALKNKANDVNNDELPKIKEEVKSEPLVEIKEEENPKISVDTESKVIADNVVSDDEFFDDFFDTE